MGLSVIIPSKTAANLIPCVEAVRKNEPNAAILIVDDGVDPDAVVGKPWGPCAFLPGKKPFVFARNVNIGINAAAEDDVVVLNDDALLRTPGGFSLLQREAQLHPEFGIIAASASNTGNVNQRPRGIGLRTDPRMVCFVAVLIPRRTIDAVSLLDERFTGYGFEDDDYCLRVRRAGLKIGIHDGCYVDHGSLKSTFRGDPRTGANLAVGHRIFVRKWGAHPL